MVEGWQPAAGVESLSLIGGRGGVGIGPHSGPYGLERFAERWLERPSMRLLLPVGGGDGIEGIRYHGTTI